MATVRNQSVSIRSRGSAIDDRNSAAKKSGNTPCTASPEPLRSADEGADAAEAERDQQRQRHDHERARRRPAAIPAPNATPTSRNVTAWISPSTRMPASWPDHQRHAAQRREREAVEEARSRCRWPRWCPRCWRRTARPGRTRSRARTRSRSRSGSRAARVAESSPLELIDSSISGNTSDGTTIAGWRSVRTTERRASMPTCTEQGGAHAGDCVLGRAPAAPPPRRPRASARSSPGRRRRAWARAAGGARRGCPRRRARAPRRRAAPRRPTAAPPAPFGRRVDRLAEAGQHVRACARSSPGSAGMTSTLGRPISALSASGVPSATIRPWSMIPTGPPARRPPPGTAS